MKEIVLCGVSHVDIYGNERLTKILEKEKPDCITLECAPEDLSGQVNAIKEIQSKRLSLAYGTRKINYTPFNQSEIVKMNRKTLVKFFSQILYEIKAAKDYSEKKNIPLLCVENKEYIDDHLVEIRKDVKKGIIYYFSEIPPEIFTLSVEYFSKYVDRTYSQESLASEIEQKGKKLVEKRDLFSSNKILEIKAKKILHIGGAKHIYGSHRNLFDLLKEKGENVRRLMLNEADEI